MNEPIINDFQRGLLRGFGQSKLAEKFYWSGGTALAAVYLKHRRSLDLDFFSGDLFPDDWILSEINKLKKASGVSLSQYHKKLNRWLFLFNKGNSTIKFELVYYPFLTVGKRKKDKDLKITVDSLIDIAANKVQTIFERQEPKDVFDLYWLLKLKKINLDKLFDLVEKKFGHQIDPITWSARAVEAAGKTYQLKPMMAKKFVVDAKILQRFFKEYSFKTLKKKIK